MDAKEIIIIVVCLLILIKFGHGVYKLIQKNNKEISKDEEFLKQLKKRNRKKQNGN